MSMRVVSSSRVTWNVGTCPACREYLWAEVDLVALIGEPSMVSNINGNPQPTVSSRAEARAMRLTHECAKEVNA